MKRRTRRARPGRGHTGDRAGGFPVIVAGASTATALVLFFATTVPALAEHRQLEEVETRHQECNDRMFRELSAESLHRMALRLDGQAMLLELDQRGIAGNRILTEPDGPQPGNRR